MPPALTPSTTCLGSSRAPPVWALPSWTVLAVSLQLFCRTSCAPSCTTEVDVEDGRLLTLTVHRPTEGGRVAEATGVRRRGHRGSHHQTRHGRAREDRGRRRL